MKIYPILLSSECIFQIGDIDIECLLNQFLKGETNSRIKCIPNKHDLIVSKKYFDAYSSNCIYLLNLNEKLNSRIFWELGYATAKGFPVICTPISNELIIPKDLNVLLESIPKDNSEFLSKMGKILYRLSPVSIFFDESASF